jgi:tetratricopeptide (TPR) repeat protein
MARRASGSPEPGLARDAQPEDDDVQVLERESVREAGALAGANRREGKTQVYGAWLDDDVVGELGETVRDPLSYGVAAMRRGSYSAAVTAFEEAVAQAGGETSSKGGQTCVWLAQALYAQGDVKVAVAMLDRLQSGHPFSNVRKAAKEIKYILEAPQLKLDESNFVKMPDSSSLVERRGRQKGEYAKMEKPPEKYSLEWYMLQKPRKGMSPQRRAAERKNGMAIVAVTGVAVSVYVAITVGPQLLL